MAESPPPQTPAPDSSAAPPPAAPVNSAPPAPQADNAVVAPPTDAPIPPPEAVAEAAALLASAQGTPAAENAPPSAKPVEAKPAAEKTTDEGEGGLVDQAAIDELLKQANFEDMSTVVNSSGAPAADAEPFKLPNFQQVLQDAQVSSIDLLRDVELNVKIELGRSRMLVEDVLKLSEGSVVELDKLAGDPVDVFVNERLVARGEVLVLNDNFCVRVNEIVAGAKEEGL
ncbi:MAG TPA: flagellar motor switch protein FliN [Tepidisphaeraceae bacterium]|nr:flagellar motor switch protein FliN [Tepidisphaeraceae bacterium]